jgi:hypothetical protein
MKRWDGSSWTLAYTDTFNPGVSTDLPGTGYFCFDLDVPNSYPQNEVVTVVLNFLVTGQSVAIRTLPNLEQNPDIDRIRVLGTSLLVSATAPELTRGGNIAIAQAPHMTSLQYLDLHCDDMYDTLSIINARECYVGNAKDGCYGYLRPAGLHDFEMVPTFVETESGVRIPKNDAEGNSWLVAAWTVPKFEDFNTGCNFRIAACHASEYMSQSQWRDLAPPTLPIEAWDSALVYISSMQQFSENPKHLSMLRSMLQSVLRGVKNHSSTAATILSLFFPQAGPLFHAGAEAASGLARLAL